MTVHRPSARKARAAVAVNYPPGFFTQPVRAWAQMRFDPHEVDAAVRRYVRNQANARRGREVALSNGSGWGSGTMDLPNTPKTLAPGWL